MIKFISSIIGCAVFIFAVVGAFTPATVRAQGCDATTVGQCLDNRICSEFADNDGNPVYGPGRNCGAAAVFGRVTAPKGLAGFNYASGADSKIGLISFFSLLLKLASIIAGIWVMFNFIMAGWLYIASDGDAGAHAKVNEKLTHSIIGILIIVAAYTIAGILSLLLFGDALFILSPTVTTIQTISTP